MTQFIFITGGVVSSIGKGIAAASLAAVLKDRGIRTTIVKLDPYINVDPGTMSPFQHGEVFVTADGCETDLDLGHYERFTALPMGRTNSFTAGQIYQDVIQKEREGQYFGGTVQVIPHIVDEIKSRLYAVAQKYQLTVVEIGGTVGDIESLPFMESIRQMQLELPKSKTAFIHLTFVPYVQNAGELKTKPTQHSVKDMRSIGLQPDVLVCRSQQPITEDVRQKIALFTNVPPKAVIGLEDVASIYSIPMLVKKRQLDQVVLNKLERTEPPAQLRAWRKMLSMMKQPKYKLRVGLVCKYCSLKDAYLSLFEAITHAAIHLQIDVCSEIVSSEQAPKNLLTKLRTFDALIVPGGFGKRGIQGKLQAIQYAREEQVPFLGICLGMQLAIIEYARHVCRLTDANSTEFNAKTPYPIIALIEQWLQQGKNTKIANPKQRGGTMRLGEEEIILERNSLLYSVYNKQTSIRERHRHRFECNNAYVPQLQDAGLTISGYSADGLVEAIELAPAQHPWFVASQFHPEFKSNPLSAHPLFLALLETAKKSHHANE